MAAADPATTRYSAFLSYSHSDAPFVRRLHHRLESYRLPARLRRGRSGRLDRIFMDRAELTAASSLTQSVREAIALSSHMIVVCSPASAASDWVGREIALFKQMHGAANVLAALYRDDANVSFHPELLPIGAPGDPEEPPIAADFRKDGDGFRLALLKLIAPLHGVELDQLIQRDAQRQVRRVIWSAAASICGVCVAGALTVSMLQAQIEAEREHARSSQMVDRLIGEERTRLKSVGRLDMLRAISRDAMNFFSGREPSQLSSEDKGRQAKLLQEMADDDIKRGDYKSAEGHVGRAMELTSELLRDEPNDPRRVYDHAQSEFWFGYMRLREGDETSALAGMQNYVALAYRLTTLEPANLDYRLERAYANSSLATF
ncbi:MAG TPA: toll/interleukin-1 receptor domain-containing protein, partial [Caulobacteraceae bacterium]|nr:toll/interleukin-1 receptor domain-containing protein [Caulobacteraceae bacterium]